MKVICSLFAIGVIIVNLPKINRMNKYDKVDLVGVQTSDYQAKAREILKEAQLRDAGKVAVKHPTLPNTWIMVSPEKAKLINAK